MLARTKVLSRSKDLLPNSWSHWQDSIPCRLQDEDLRFFLDVKQTPLSVTHSVVLSIGSPRHDSLLLKSQHERDSSNRTSVRILLNIIMKVTHCYICHIQLARSKSQVLPTIKGRGPPKEHKNVKVMEVTLEPFYYPWGIFWLILPYSEWLSYSYRQQKPELTSKERYQQKPGLTVKERYLKIF